MMKRNMLQKNKAPGKKRSLMRRHLFEKGQFDFLTKRIIYSSYGCVPHVAMVTGTVPGEESGYAAANLALNIAKNPRRCVLLVDLDWYRPSVHTCFSYGDVAGLSDYFAGKVSLSYLLLETNMPNLKILPWGKPVKNIADTYAIGKIAACIKALKDAHRDKVIVINMTSPKMLDKSWAIAHVADSISLVVRRGDQRRKNIDEMLTLFGRKKVVGVIDILEEKKTGMWTKIKRLPALAGSLIKTERTRWRIFKNSGNDEKSNLISLLHPNSFESEQFKMLTANITSTQFETPPKTIMVTSAVPNEGKSFVSANLAISIAKSTKKPVFLIDCDLRRPSLHRYFGHDVSGGLSAYLAGECAYAELFIKTKINKLFVIPGGESSETSFEMLSSKKMAKLISGLRRKYKNAYIVIDSAPAPLTAEGSVLAQLVDGVALVVRHSQTRREEIKGLIDMLGRERFLGVIVNNIPIKTKAYYNCAQYDKK